MQAGVGFWLTEPKQVRQLAEQLAKAQFAARRDPHDCALMYIALGKKTLLQVTCTGLSSAETLRLVRLGVPFPLGLQSTESWLCLTLA